MTKSIFIGSAAIFAIISLFQLSAHAEVAESHACPTSSLPSDGGKMPAPSPRWLPSGCETSTAPWSAPVGHRQPQAGDVPPITEAEEALAAENAKVDHIIRICRGC
jgi:hypothetical protein